MKGNKRGFSLVELIVVIAIITSLTAMGITSYSAVQRNARNTERKTDLKDIEVALEAYRLETGAYPNTWGSWLGAPGCAWGGTTNWIPGLAPNFIDKLPLDPRTAQANASSANWYCTYYASWNCYLYLSNGVQYKLLAHCSPEGTMISSDPFYDPVRPVNAWQISSDAIPRNSW